MGVTGTRERATFSLDPETKARLERAVPKRQRSRFVEEAIEAALREEDRRQAIEAIRNFPRVKVKDGSVVETLREIRRERSDYLARRHGAKSE